MFLIVGICLLLALFIPPTAVLSTTGPAGHAASGLSPNLVSPPTVFAHRTLLVNGPSATSGKFSSQAGDAVFVFVSVYGGNSVGVTDSAHDTFASLVTVSQHTSKAYNGLEIFAAYNVSAGTTKTLTATLSGPSTDSAAADIVDVTGVAPAPSVTLGTAENYSTASNREVSSTVVPAAGSDLVLAGISAIHTHTWSAVAGETLLNNAHESASSEPLTAADVSTVAGSTGNVYANATTPSNNTYWITDGLSVHSLTLTSYSVTFSESGLPSRHAWDATLSGAVGTSKKSSIVFSEPNGTYRFDIGSISGYIASPSSGFITVAGASRAQAIAFGPDTSNWTTYLGGVARNSATTGETAISPSNAQNLSLLWTAYTGHVQTEPAVLNGVVYAGAISGYEYALNASTGATVWKTYVGQVTQPNCDPSPTGLTSSATLSGGMVYVGGGNITGNLTNGTAGWYALNATTGAIAWSIPIGNAGIGYYNWASPLIADGNAYIGVASRCDEPLVWGGVLQVSLTTHSVIGFFNTTVGGGKTRGSSVWGSPTFDQPNNTIFFTTGNPFKTHVTNYSESVVAINATTLAPVSKWQIPAAQVSNVSDSDFGTTPDYFHLPNGTPMLTAVNKNGILYAFNPTSLSSGPVWQSWVTNSQDPPTVDPAAYGGGLLYQGGGATTLSGVNASGSVRAYYPGNGTVKWHLALEGDVFGAPVYSNGILAVNGGNELAVVNASSGALLWNWTCKSWFESAPTIAEGRIYAGCHNLYAFGFTGTPVAGAMISATPGSVAVRTGGATAPSIEIRGEVAPPTYVPPMRALAMASRPAQ
jgi:outer membrane protein assembly factor BamB